jgi:hypothetical protein
VARRGSLEAVLAGNRKYACLLVNRELIALACLGSFAVGKPHYEYRHRPLNLSIGGWQVAARALAGAGSIDRIKVLLSLLATRRVAEFSALARGYSSRGWL